MNLLDGHRRVDKGATVGNCRMNRLLFADELVLHACVDFRNRVFITHFIGFLLRATKKKRKLALKRLRCYVSPKAVFSASKRQCTVAGGDVQVPWVVFTSDESRYKEIDTRIGKANAVLCDLYCSVLTKRELSKNAKLSVFESDFVPLLTCGHES